MEDWLLDLKSVSSRKYLDPSFDQHEILSNNHHWSSTSHARPTYCNVCREALPGITSHGLSCEICKFKVHKRCAGKAIANCKWTTLATVGKDIIENKDGSIVLPHQWMEGNLPVASTCTECRKTCGSVLRLQDWRCLWCQATVHTICRPVVPEKCPIGPAKVSVVPPTSVHSIGTDESWDIISPKGNFSPLLVFVNSKSGENHGVKFFKRFKQLLNPVQVFDLNSSGPSLGLRLFRRFDNFRILVCSGDGSVGWVLSEIDRFNIHKQCQVAVLPLGTGNDLARVLGWGSSCDDDAHLPQVLERYETASTKMLDRWSIMVFEKSFSLKPSDMALTSSQEAFLTELVTSVNEKLQSIIETDDVSILLFAVTTLCEHIDELSDVFCKNQKDDDQLVMKCDILRQKLNMLLDALRIKDITQYLSEDSFVKTMKAKDQYTDTISISTMKKTEKDEKNSKEQSDSRKNRPIEKENIQCRANSIKRAIYNLLEHSKPGRPKKYERKLSINPFEIKKVKATNNELSECVSTMTIPPINIISPSNSTDHLICLSPLPDSVDDNFLNTFSIPVPSQFADVNKRLDDTRNINKNDEYINSQPMRLNTSNDAQTLLIQSNTGSKSDLFHSTSNNCLKNCDYLTISSESSYDYGSIENFTRNSQIAPEQENNFAIEKNGDNKKIGITKNKGNIHQLYKLFDSMNDKDERGESINTADYEQSQTEVVQGNDTFEINNTDSSQLNLDLYQSSKLTNMQDSSLNALHHIDSPDQSDGIEVNMDTYIDGNFIAAASKNKVLSEDICSDVLGKQVLSTCLSSSQPQNPCIYGLEQKNQQFGFENIVFEIDNRCDDQKIREPPKYCTLLQFIQGNDIDNRILNHTAPNSPKSLEPTKIEETLSFNYKPEPDSDVLNNGIMKQISSPQKMYAMNQDIKRITFEDSCKTDSLDDENPKCSSTSVNVRHSHLTAENANNESVDIRRHSSHYASVSSQEFKSEKYRRHSDNNTKNLNLEPEHIKYLNSSRAATRRISCGSLFKPREGLFVPTFKSSTTNLNNSSLFGFDHLNGKKKEEKDSKENELTDDDRKKLPIINPLVRLPSWPNISHGTGFISKCLLANADTLCAAVSPLMDPDETLLEGYHEKCVMNNYFGIGIDAKISLDFHNKREEHPEKCRSRARNYMWYGVLGSKQLLQKTYKNLEQRVQLECDGQRIPLPSLQGIVILNIPSFMGGTNFWGSTKKDDVFLPPSFDDRILEVVAVFGSAQMAASRLINLQHHRIAQCQSVQINILGNEEVPIQVDGEAWLQPPGMIRILHKNRVQMLCRNKNLEMSLKQWEEKKLQQSNSMQRYQSLTTWEQGSTISEDNLSERECHVLLNFIEAISSLVKWVKFLIISHPFLCRDLYAVASRTSDTLESIHPNGKLLEGPSFRTKLVDVIDSSRHLYDDTSNLLRDRSSNLILREDLEAKLSAALANMEMELKKCSVQKCADGKARAYFSDAVPHEDLESRKKPFWVRLRSGSAAYNQPFKPTANTRDVVCNWSVTEVGTWLEAMQMSEYVDNFIKNDIRGRELLGLNRRDLKDLGVVKVGHVKRIQEAIKDLCKN